MKYAKEPKSALNDQLPRIIYVEGHDDAWFINALLDEIGADASQVGIIYLQGNGEIEKELKYLTKSSAYVSRKTTSVAVILDADVSAAQTLSRLHASLDKRGLPTPAAAEISVYDDNRRLGVYILPDGLSTGAIEELLMGTIAHDNRLVTVDGALTSIEAEHGALDHRMKRLVRMYLSALPIKPCGIGRAYCEGVFDKSHGLLDPLRTFLQEFIS